MPSIDIAGAALLAEDLEVLGAFTTETSARNRLEQRRLENTTRFADPSELVHHRVEEKVYDFAPPLIGDEYSLMTADVVTWLAL
ncbi:hypothetical protein DLJ54_03275 [Corynebacterium heidelbergense]|uniref:Uncharacterized protein n=1 Tax=Corynebacterium heidelbergense TaxID=2055947 RepID=A0A364V729_9CORY|nr:hypothetical protein DLJ54_03275 [Corynebacterium heidelbergense]